jgi:DNA polymerase I-like protein with 3'-5' exonuclease and polymerase domains
MFGIKRIQSFKDFHRLVPEILQRMNEDQELALRATANPLLAFREMGLRLTDEVEKEVEKILRFTPRERKQLEDLEKELHKHTEKPVDFRSNEEVGSFLLKDLKLRKAKDFKSVESSDVLETARILLSRKKKAWSDPLQELKDAHPVMPALLEYRRIYHGKPGFASKAYYNELKSGKRKLPITGIRLTFPGGAPTHEEE